MGVYDQFADKPNQIKLEGQEITLTYQRTGDDTARISWNIPAPSAGCNSATQAYNGIVITVSNTPANYLSNSPKDGVYYKDDPTFDSDLHSGDKLDGALVLAALYDDKYTTYIDVTGVKDKTPYYVSGYAVDKVARYHTEGVHAYSLPSGPQEPNDSKDLPAIQDIGIDTMNGINPSTLTGLENGVTYTATFIIDEKKYTITVPGAQALDYDDLIYYINQQFISLTVPKYVGPYPPHTNEYYVDVPNETVYQWDGWQNVPKTALFQDTDPTIPVLGKFWYNPDTKVLYEYETAGWVTKDYLTSAYDFSSPQCYQFWFDGTTVYKWEKVVWCELPTYISTTNPLIPTGLDCSTYWYNTDTLDLTQWNEQTHAWDAVEAIYYDRDPHAVTSGSYWYNQTDGKVYIYLSGAWSALTNIVYVEPTQTGDYPYPPAPNHYWFVPSTQKLYRRNMSNTTWVELDVILYTSDPTVAASCQLWWNSSPSIDSLFVWDTVNLQWVAVSHFYQTNVDPDFPVDIPFNSAWYNPDTKIVTIINNPDCTPIYYVYSPTDPTVLVAGEIWFNDVDNKWFEWNGTAWVQIYPFVTTLNPFSVTTGEFWYNTDTDLLYIWNGTAWVETPFSATSLAPTVGDLWFNELDNKLYEWTGTTWIETVGVAYATLIMQTKFTCDGCRGTHYNYWNYNDGWALPYPKDILRIATKKTGCSTHIELCFDTPPTGTKPLFGNLKQNVIYFMPLDGQSKSQSNPMYLQVGVGTDGSPDERRAMHSTVRISLGDPSQKVELTKEQIDQCINNALLEFRKRASFSYSRKLFFLDVKPNQQLYILKNQCVGYNKIVDINAIYRSRGGFMNNVYGGDNIFGYAALQQLYTLGTFDMLSFHLVASYTEDLQMLFADNIMFQWVEAKRELRTYKNFYGCERVLIDCVIEKTEQDLLTSRDSAIWLQKWAIADAKGMLSQIRGKFQTLPGPSGSTTLNGQDLATQSESEKAALIEELSDFLWQDVVDIGMRSHFIVG